MKKTNLLLNDPVLDALDARLAMSAPSVAAIASAGQAQTGQEIMGMMAAMSAGRSSQPIVTTAAQGSSAGPAIAAGVVGLAVGGILDAALAGSSKKEAKMAATPSAGGHAPVTMTTFKRQAAETLAPGGKLSALPSEPAQKDAGKTVPAAPKPENANPTPAATAKPATTPPATVTPPTPAPMTNPAVHSKRVWISSDGANVVREVAPPAMSTMPPAASTGG